MLVVLSYNLCLCAGKIYIVLKKVNTTATIEMHFFPEELKGDFSLHKNSYWNHIVCFLAQGTMHITNLKYKVYFLCIQLELKKYQSVVQFAFIMFSPFLFHSISTPPIVLSVDIILRNWEQSSEKREYGCVAVIKERQVFSIFNDINSCTKIIMKYDKVKIVYLYNV